MSGTRRAYSNLILYNAQGEILFLRRSLLDDFCPGAWCLPGGGIDGRESPQAAARRELYEETAILLPLSRAYPQVVGKFTGTNGATHWYSIYPLFVPIQPILKWDEHINYCRCALNTALTELNLLLDLPLHLQMLQPKIPVFPWPATTKQILPRRPKASTPVPHI